MALIMRAAAILGPGNLARPVAAFQRLAGVEWTSLIEQADAAVIFGGDGTVHRHLSELVELEIPVLVVPCGSGNDFARALGVRRMRDAVAAWKRFASGDGVRAIDLGVISSLLPQGLKPSGQPTGTAEALHPITRTPRAMGTPAVPFPSGNIRAAGVLATQKTYFCCVAGVGIDTAIAR